MQEKRDQKITGKDVNIYVISTSVKNTSMSIEDIQVATYEDAHLQKLRSYTIQG